MNIHMVRNSGAGILVPYIIFKLLSHTWSSGARRCHLYVFDIFWSGAICKWAAMTGIQWQIVGCQFNNLSSGYQGNALTGKVLYNPLAIHLAYVAINCDGHTLYVYQYYYQDIILRWILLYIIARVSFKRHTMSIAKESVLILLSRYILTYL